MPASADYRASSLHKAGVSYGTTSAGVGWCAKAMYSMSYDGNGGDLQVEG